MLEPRAIPTMCVLAIKKDECVESQGFSVCGITRILFSCLSRLTHFAVALISPFSACFFQANFTRNNKLLVRIRRVWCVWCKPGGGPHSKAYHHNLGLSSCTFLCTVTVSDDDKKRPQHTTQTHNKDHHHGGRANNPSGGLDWMNPHHPRDWRP